MQELEEARSEEARLMLERDLLMKGENPDMSVILDGRVEPVAGKGPDANVGNKDGGNEFKMMVPLQGQMSFCVENRSGIRFKDGGTWVRIELRMGLHGPILRR